ncbi:unnamed protein product (mitochondrion) [Plasmodiophora brassicae]|uniref:EF-hand domain-containing protein n=1 Tax=Plasmodiophora brassicae TaxID=37360 RepID=A0A0G4J6Z8_PLABS|nr:hypothetical protein PBRA_009289 [Plasmodiophora brassicae]SPQ96995.1 unnamed protein product [Plasmodiophora brassicae]
MDDVGRAGDAGTDDGQQGVSINAESLELLKTYFDEADGGLEEDEFVSLLGKVLGKQTATNRRDLTHLFMKIDANSDGTVDWDEFTHFLLMENQANEFNDTSFDELVPSPVPEPADNAHHYHRDMIETVLYIPKTDKYVTSSRDGTFKVWNCKDRLHVRTVRCGNSWIIGSCLLPRSNRLAMVSADLRAHFYDATSIELVSRFNDDPVTRNNGLTFAELRRQQQPQRLQTMLENMPVCVTGIPSPTEDIMAIGDTMGTITIHAFDEKWHACDGAIAECSHDSPKCIGVRREAFPGVHTDWVTDIKWIPELDALVTSSLDRTVKFLDVERHGQDPVRKKFTGHRKGVYSFDFCAGYKFMVSCGSSRRITAWDPFRCREINSLSGHMAAVQQVVVNEDKNQIISLAVDKTIKVWDVRNFRCMQTITDANHYRPENRISRLTWVKAHSCLLAATNRLDVWPSKAVSQAETLSHDHSICTAIYNSNFGQVVSGDVGSQVKVWDLETGRSVFSYRNVHRRASSITAMALDASMRRLITGGDDGSVKVWNFSSGQCLSDCVDGAAPGRDRREVTSLAFIVDDRSADSPSKFIVAGGWDARIRVWEDHADKVQPIASTMAAGAKGHTGDITCMVWCGNTWLASGGADGAVVIWSLDSKCAKRRLVDGAESTSVDALAWLPTLSLLISAGSDGRVRGWDGSRTSWPLVMQVAGSPASSPAGIMAIVKSGNDRTLVTGDSSGYVKVWATVRQPQVGIQHARTWRAHERSISSLSMVDGREMLVTTATDRRIRLWSLDGSLVGMFVSDRAPWSLTDRSTWQSPANLLRMESTTKQATDEASGEPAAEDDAQAADQELDGYWDEIKKIRANAEFTRLKTSLLSGKQASQAPRVPLESSPSYAKPGGATPASQAANQYRIHQRLNLARVEDVPLCGYSPGASSKSTKDTAMRAKKRTA